MSFRCSLSSISLILVVACGGGVEIANAGYLAGQSWTFVTSTIDPDETGLQAIAAVVVRGLHSTILFAAPPRDGATPRPRYLLRQIYGGGYTWAVLPTSLEEPIRHLHIVSSEHESIALVTQPQSTTDGYDSLVVIGSAGGEVHSTIDPIGRLRVSESDVLSKLRPRDHGEPHIPEWEHMSPLEKRKFLHLWQVRENSARRDAFEALGCLPLGFTPLGPWGIFGCGVINGALSQNDQDDQLSGIELYLEETRERIRQRRGIGDPVEGAQRHGADGTSTVCPEGMVLRCVSDAAGEGGERTRDSSFVPSARRSCARSARYRGAPIVVAQVVETSLIGQIGSAGFALSDRKGDSWVDGTEEVEHMLTVTLAPETTWTSNSTWRLRGGAAGAWTGTAPVVEMALHGRATIHGYYRSDTGLRLNLFVREDAAGCAASRASWATRLAEVQEPEGVTWTIGWNGSLGGDCVADPVCTTSNEVQFGLDGQAGRVLLDHPGDPSTKVTYVGTNVRSGGLWTTHTHSHANPVLEGTIDAVVSWSVTCDDLPPVCVCRYEYPRQVQEKPREGVGASRAVFPLPVLVFEELYDPDWDRSSQPDSFERGVVGTRVVFVSPDGQTDPATPLHQLPSGNYDAEVTAWDTGGQSTTISVPLTIR